MCLGCGQHRLQVNLKYTSEEEGVIKSKVPKFNKKLWLQKGKKLLDELIKNNVDCIIKGGQIYTMDPTNPIAEAVALKGSRIVYAGKEEEAMKLKNVGTRIIDLGGKTMLPGFVEPHVHTSSVYFDKWIDLGPFVNATTSDVEKTLIEAVKKAEAAG